MRSGEKKRRIICDSSSSLAQQHHRAVYLPVVFVHSIWDFTVRGCAINGVFSPLERLTLTLTNWVHVTLETDNIVELKCLSERYRLRQGIKSLYQYMNDNSHHSFHLNPTKFLREVHIHAGGRWLKAPSHTTYCRKREPDGGGLRKNWFLLPR